jgi:hypothetical protein
MSSDAQIKANRANAELSTGPTSDIGKNKSSLNAVKTGLTGRTVLLPSDDAEAYSQLVAGFFKHWNPNGDAEHLLVQALADTEWRLMRIPSLEMGICALGRLEFAGLFADQDESVRKHLIEAKIALAYERPLKNLSLQESRLRRQREKDTAALRELQEIRHRAAQERLDSAAYRYINAVCEDRNDDFDLGQFGFEFSLEQIEVRAMEIDPKLFDVYEQELAEKRAAKLRKVA